MRSVSDPKFKNNHQNASVVTGEAGHAWCLDSEEEFTTKDMGQMVHKSQNLDG